MPSRRTRRAVTEILERGAQTRTPFFVLRRMPGNSTPFVVAAGKKTFPRAVDRNRVRRRLKAAARVAGADLPGSVVIARVAASDGAFASMVRTFEGRKER